MDDGTWTVCANLLIRWRINGEMLEMEQRTTTVGRWVQVLGLPVAAIRACLDGV